MRCHFCRIWEEPHKELTTAEWKQVIRNLDTLGILFLSFTGGEPLLRSDVYELIDYAADLGLIPSITSGSHDQNTIGKRYRRSVDSRGCVN